MDERDDAWRLDQLHRSLSNPEHPYHHFSLGNSEVLKVRPKLGGLNIRDLAIEFFHKHYSANLMKLVVLGRESLGTLEDWVVESFSPIPNKNLEPARWPDPPFTPDQLGTTVFAKPVSDLKELVLRFPFLDEDLLYESLPSSYICHLVGHEGKGSILSNLKSKGWASGLIADMQAVCPGSPGVFVCQIRLTEEGLQKYKEVLEVFFQYVSLLQEEPQEWVFEEIKVMDDANFKFGEESEAMDFTSELSFRMQSPLPRNWLLSGHRTRKFESQLIKQGIQCLKPERLMLTVVSPSFPGKWKMKEEWFGTEYTSERIPNDLMAQLREARHHLPLHLPSKNKFIPAEFKVHKEVKDSTANPYLIRDDKLARIWYKPDARSGIPKVNVSVRCRSTMLTTARSLANAFLLTRLIEDALNELHYDASLGGLSCTLGADAQGLLFHFRGYKPNLPLLLEEVARTLRHFEIREARFNKIKESNLTAWRNDAFETPFNRVGEYVTWLTTDNPYLLEHLADGLSMTTYDAIRVFQEDSLMQMHLEALVHGNTSTGDALMYADTLVNTLGFAVLPNSQWAIQRSFLFPPGSNYTYRMTLSDPASINHCIKYWLCIAQRDELMKRAELLLLAQILEAPAFKRLRTEEQLGYGVYTKAGTTGTTHGFGFVVQSEKPPQYIELRIEEFLKNYAVTLAEMGDTDLDDFKRSLCASLVEKPKNLNKKTNRVWKEISAGSYDFEWCRFYPKNTLHLAETDNHTAKRIAACVENVSKQDIVRHFNEHINPASATRQKISVWMTAQAADTVATITDSSVEREDAGMQSLHDTEICFIEEDVNGFKAGLSLSPGPRPVTDLEEFKGNIDVEGGGAGHS